MEPTLALNWDTIRSILRWCIVGGLFTAFSVPVLYVLRGVLGLPLMIATLLTWEIGTVLRFLVNDLWVFKERWPTWQRFWKYHGAVAGTFVIWWTATNVIPRWGVHYLIASVLGTCGSFLWSLCTNFLWVWRRKESS